MYSVKNYRKFQHFKDRRPIWIKLYRDLLDDMEWHNLDPKAAKCLVMIWLVASEDQGKLPPLQELAFRLRISEIELRKLITTLGHWLIQDDINSISDGYQDDSAEKRREEKRQRRDREETHVASATSESGSVVIEIFSYWQSAMDHPQAQLTPKRKQKIQARLKEGYSADQIRKAIDGCRSSPWHQGQNDSAAVFDDIELICRDGCKLEFFIGKVSHEPIKQVRRESTSERNAREVNDLLRRSAESWTKSASGGDCHIDQTDEGENWPTVDIARRLV